MDNEREKWIARADAYKRNHGSEMVTIFRHGIYENWPAVQFDKLGDSADVVYRTDGVIPQILRMTVSEYAKSVYERMG